jgi:hypothetical protein
MSRPLSVDKTKRERPCTKRTAALATLLAFVTLLVVPSAMGTASPRLFGSYRDCYPGNGECDVLARESVYQRRVDIVHWFQPWGNSPGREWDASLVRDISSSGRIPYISWEAWDWSKGAYQPAYSMRSITRGKHDAYLRSWADGVKAYGKRVYIAILEEADNPANPNPWSLGANGTTASNSRAAYRHIVTLFRKRGAKNVRWVWTILGGPRWKAGYPGRDYVSVLAFDALNKPEWNDGVYKAWASIVGGPYDKLVSLGTRKRIWMGQTATAHYGGDPGAWIDRMFTTLRSGAYPRLCAVLWFDRDKTFAGEADWTWPALPDWWTPKDSQMGSCRRK